MRIASGILLTLARLKTALAFLAVAVLVALLPAGLLPATVLAAPAPRTIHIQAGDFAFSPGVVQVNPGDRVTIELAAQDVTHSLSIDGYAVDLRAEPGQTARVTFVADRAGSFKIRCTVACGNLHPFMTGKFDVGPNLALLRGVGLALLAFAYSALRTLGVKRG